jgi:SAM-dependent methyltransferase
MARALWAGALRRSARLREPVFRSRRTTWRLNLGYDSHVTEFEYATFRPNAEVLRYLELTRNRLGLNRSEMNVLDWGSGRGEYVAWLRDAGYNAFGAEIRNEVTERGRAMLEARGHDIAHVIRIIPASGETNLPADFFHFVFTHYVLEHVADIDTVTKEIDRVTAPGGCGFHVYPGKLRPIEPHLFMPFVHWLPKNPARRWAISVCLACGIEPRWDWLAKAAFTKKAQAYYEYCINETFYRSFREVRYSFSKMGFVVTPVSADHPALRRLTVLPAVLRKFLVELPVMMFYTVEILVHKSSGAPVRS